MADITRGRTYGATEEQTNVKLHELVDSASVSNIVRADIAQSISIVSIGAAAPSSSPTPIAGHLWYNTTDGVLNLYDGTDWNLVARGYTFTNKSGGALTNGDVVVLDTSNANAVTTTTSANDIDVFGVVIVGGANDAIVSVITEGYVPALTVTGATAIGDYLSTSTTVKKADPSATHGQGAFARALTTSSTSVEAQVGGASLTAAVSGSRFTALDETTSTRLGSAASGAQVISHSLGVIPSIIDCYTASQAIGATGANEIANGTCKTDGTNFAQYCSTIGASIAAAGVANAVTAVSDGTTTNRQTGVITAVTSTNFTVTWTLAGTVAGTMHSFWVLSA